MLADDPAAVPLAGGTDLLVHWPANHAARERTYIDLTSAGELRTHRWSDRDLVIGGTTTYWDLIRDPRTAAELPLLVDAARLVGAVQIQSRGTWAGNVVNASPAADGVPVLMAYGATVVLRSSADTREVALAEFYTGYKEMRRDPTELVTEIRVPLEARRIEVFHKVGSRRAQAIAKVGLALVDTGNGWRVVAASLAPTVRRCPAVERGFDAGGFASVGEAVAALSADVSPIDDVRSTAEYRLGVAGRLIHHEASRAGR